MKRAVSALVVCLSAVLLAVSARAENPEDGVYAAYRQPGKTWTPFGLGYFGGESAQAVYGVELAPLASKRERIVGVQLAGIGAMTSEAVWGLQLGGFGASARELYGLQLASFAASAETLGGLTFASCGVEIGGDMTGLACCGFMTSVKRSAYGFQVSGFCNDVSRDVAGVQVALTNLAHRDVTGLQLAALGNDANGDCTGVQISALGNRVGGRFCGLQIGLVNEAAKGTFVQLGLINFGIVRKNGQDETSFFPLLRAKFD